MNLSQARLSHLTPGNNVARQEIVERAEGLLRASGRESVSLKQLCREIGIKERTLRNAFYDVRGLSPMRFAMRERLNDARRRLQGVGLEKGAVTRVATEYGFYELGRFAGSYKAVFGETPSETLRKRHQAACTASGTEAVPARRAR